MKSNCYTTTLIGLTFFTSMLISGCTPGGQQEQSPEKVKPQTFEEKVSYGIGVDIGRDIRRQELELEQELLIQGIRDGLGDEPALSEEELANARKEFIEMRKAALQQEAARNLEEEESFLAENAQKEGVVTLPSGLQYRIITPGEGARPTADDNVKVHYRGYFIDGTEFDNTYEQERPAVFPIRSVIPGWTEAILLMQEGAKWELFVPAKLAYGERGAGSKIGPNKTLIFEVELLEIHL